METILGKCHEECYVLVHAADGDAYGYGRPDAERSLGGREPRLTALEKRRRIEKHAAQSSRGGVRDRLDPQLSARITLRAASPIRPGRQPDERPITGSATVTFYASLGVEIGQTPSRLLFRFLAVEQPDRSAWLSWRREFLSRPMLAME